MSVPERIGVNIRHRSGTRKTGIDNDQGCIVVVFASIAQRKPTGCASAALPPITITTLAFFDIHPVVGHRTATKC